MKFAGTIAKGMWSKLFKTLYVVTESNGAELPVLVADNLKEVSLFLGKPVSTTSWYFSPSGQKRRDGDRLFNRNLYVPYKFYKVRVNMEDD